MADFLGRRLPLQTDDAGAAYQTGLSSFGTASMQAADSLHPNAVTNGQVAVKYGALIQHALEPRRFTVVGS